MAFKAEERLKSRRQNDTSAEFKYVVYATGNDVLNELGAKAAAQSQCAVDLDTPSGWPSVYNGLRYNDTELEDYLGNGIYLFTIKFGMLTAFITQGLTEVELDTTGGTERIKMALAVPTTNQFPVSDDSTPRQMRPNDGLLDCDRNGEPHGTDVPARKFAFNMTWVMPATMVTSAYIDMLYRATGCTNSATWTVTMDGGGSTATVPFGTVVGTTTKTFQPGECLFLGVRGRKPNANLWATSWSFAAQPNLVGYVIPGSNIAPIYKRGWDYMWPDYGLVKLPDGTYVNGVLGMNVAHVVGEYDFNAFGLP